MTCISRTAPRCLAAFLLVVLGIAADFSGQAIAQQSSSVQAATRQFAAAAALQNRQQFELAADEWQKFLATHASDSRANDARYYLGLCQLKLEQYGPAAAALQETIAVAEKSSRPFDLLPSAYLYLGLAQYKLAQAGHPQLFQEADETFARLLKEFPGDESAAEARLYRGETLYAQGKRAEAVKLYRELIDNHGASSLVPQALYALGVTQQELGQHAEAEKTYREFLAKNSGHRLAAEVTMRRGEALFELKQFDDAEELFASVSGKTDFNLADHALMGQADSLFARRKYAEAAALYEQLPKRFAESTLKDSARLAAGKSRLLAGQSAQAQALLEPLADGKGEQSVEAAHWLARALLQESQAAEALKVVEQALSTEPGPMQAQLQLDRADALFELKGRRDEALKAYAEIAAQHAKADVAPQALYMAAFTALAEGDHKATFDYVEQFLDRYADDALVPQVRHVQAEARLRKGDHEQAAKLYAELLDDLPDHDQSGLWQVRRGLALWLADDFSAVIAALEPALPKLRDKPLVAEAQWLVGSSRQQLGESAAAIKALEASLAADASWRQADQTLLTLGAAYRAAGDTGRAIERLRQLIERHAGSSIIDEAHFRLAEYLSASNQFDDAQAQYQRLLEGWSKSSFAPHALYDLGWIQLRQGQNEQAVDTFTRLIDGYGKHNLVNQARYSRGLARQQLGQFQEALADIEKFLASKPSADQQADARYVQARCQVGLGEHDEAARTLEKLLKDKPDYVDADRALYELGWAYKEAGDEKQAASAFARLIEQHGDSSLAAESSYHVAEAAYAAEDYRRAAVAYHKAMNAASDVALAEKAAHKLGWSYFHQNEIEKAQQTFAYQRAKYAQGPLAGDARFMEAECLFKLGNYRDALAAYQAVREPSVPEFTLLALLGAGKSQAELEQWDAALTALQQAAQQAADSSHLPEIIFEQARIKHRQGKLEEALALYEQVTAESGAEVAARSRFMVGEIYFEQQDHAEAIRNFFKVAYGYSYPVWQAQAHYEAGRCFEVLGKTAQARESYQEVVKNFADSEQAPLAEQRLAALESGS